MRHFGLRGWMLFIGIFCFYISINSFFVFGRMFPSSKGVQGYHGKFNLGFHHRFPDYLFQAREYVEGQRENFNLFLLPPSRANVYEWGYAGAGEVSLLLFNRGILFQQYGEGFAPPNNLDAFYQMASKAILVENGAWGASLLQLLNARFILQRNDFVYNFFGDHKYSPSFISQALQKTGFKKIKTFGKWDLYETGLPLLPVIYTPSQAYLVELNQVVPVLSRSDYGQRSAFFISKEDRSKLAELEDPIVAPYVEFKKINPAKYRIRIHGARGKFPLVFSQIFHSGWRLYSATSNREWKSSSGLSLDGYKVFYENDESQASPTEVANYISKGWVTDLGDGTPKKIKYKKWGNWKEIVERVETLKINFISKEKYGSVQNDNLPHGKFYETWFMPQVSAERHVRVNTFANGWILDADKLCGEMNNNDRNGGCEAELIMEFAPLRLFYIGCAISLLTTIGCLLGFWFFKNRNNSSGEYA